MTAMSDVTVLFGLYVDINICEEGAGAGLPFSLRIGNQDPETDVLQILVDQEGKIFMSLDKQQDMQAVLWRVWKSMASSLARNRQKRFQWLLRLECLSSVYRNSLTPEDQRDKILPEWGPLW